MKLIDNFPILLFYGKLHVINGVRSETEEKLGEPYNPCRESSIDEKYRKKNCYGNCIYNELVKKYNCTFKNSLFEIKGFEQCKSTFLIENYFFKNYELFELNCQKKCPDGCESVKFNSQITQFEFDSSDKNQNIIQFYISDFSSLKIKQTPKSTFFSFISADIGGALGLFMGISLLNFIEILEFIVDFLFISFSL